jgi:hypothetical protein
MKHQNSHIHIINYKYLTNIMSGKENCNKIANRVQTTQPTSLKSSLN